MNFDWQNLSVLLLVGVAAAYLACAAWSSVARRKAAGCGGCGTCSAGTDKQAVIGVQELAATAASAKLADRGKTA